MLDDGRERERMVENANDISRTTKKMSRKHA